MVLKASSIEECPNLEDLWNINTSPDSANVTSGNILLSHSDVGPYVHVICPDGYHVMGSAMITCLKGGLWDDARKPYCSSSSMYGLAESDLLLLGVLTGCGAIAILVLTIVLSRLLCFRGNDARSGTSIDRINHGVDTITTPYHKHYSSVSPPTSPTLNGKPLTPTNRSNIHSHHALNSTHNHAFHRDNQLDAVPTLHGNDQHFGQSHRTYTVPHSQPLSTVPAGVQPFYASSHVPRDVPERMTSLEEGGVFVNQAFTDDIGADYATSWENQRNLHVLRARQNQPSVRELLEAVYNDPTPGNNHPSPPPGLPSPLPSHPASYPGREPTYSHPSPLPGHPSSPSGHPAPPSGRTPDFSVENRTTF